MLLAAGVVYIGVRGTDGVFLEAPRSYPEANPATVGLAHEEIWFRGEDGVELSGWWIHAKCPAQASVVAVPGYTSNRGELLGISLMFTSACYNVFAVDVRGQNRSGGYPTLGTREPGDIAAAVDVASRNGLPVVLYGQSMGGASVIIAAAELNSADPSRVRAVVADSAYATAESALRRGIPRSSGYPEFPTVPITMAAARIRLGIDISSVRPVDSATILAAPLLVVHGKADEVVPFSDGERIYRAASEPKELWAIDGVGHVRGYAERPEEFSARVLGFLGRYAVA